jgi:c-di-GMP-binding flagellar brake protein YcgR
MREVIVYPSTKIEIICPACYAAKIFEFAEPPTKGFEFKCSSCNEIITVELNRRAFYRKELSIPVYYSLNDFDNIMEPDIKSGWMRDISKGGIKIEISPLKYSDDYEKIGNILTIFFSLPPQNKQIKVKGEIVRVSKEQKFKLDFGVRFLELSEDQKQIISFFLRP